MIALRGAAWTWPSGGSVGPVDLDVAAGECVLLTGPTGCGKSTVLRLAAGLLQRHGAGRLHGSVSVDGEDPASMVAARRVGAIGLVAQDPDDQVITGSVAAEIAFGLESAGWTPSRIDARITEVIATVGLTGLADRDPRRLSGGQRQRLMIGAALAAGAHTLLLDEPLAQLDPVGAAEVVAVIRRYADAGVAVLLVEHRLEPTWDAADRVVLMDRGLVVADPVRDVSPLEQLGLRGPALRDLERRMGHPGPWQARLPSLDTRDTSGNVLIRLVDVSAGYPDRPSAIRVDLAVRSGERVALVGVNGAGKTTLIRALTGRGISAGRREVHGRVIDVPQDPDLALFAPTVAAELAYGPEEHRVPDVAARVTAAAAALSIGDLLDRVPQSLSRGQRLRVAVAAALSCAPEVLLLDEPTSGQDGDQVDRMMAGLRASLPGALVFASHDLDVALRHATRVVVLAGGRIVADGPPLPTLVASGLPLPPLAALCVELGLPYGTAAELADRLEIAC